MPVLNRCHEVVVNLRVAIEGVEMGSIDQADLRVQRGGPLFRGSAFAIHHIRVGP